MRPADVASSPGPVILPAGRVGRAHGLDGSFYVQEAIPALLQTGSEVDLGGRRYVLVRRAGTDERPIVRLEGVADREAAEALRGVQLTVARSEAPALGEDEWWAGELEGCTVRDGPLLLGTVSRLLALPSCEVLEVRRQGSEEVLLVPMVKDAIRSIEPEVRVIEVDSEFLDIGADARQSARAPAPGARAGGRGRGSRQ